MEKQFIKDIKSWLIISLIFIITVWIFWTVFAAISHVNNWDNLTSTKWNELVDTVNTSSSSIPSWAVVAYNLISCPVWWSAADWTDSPIDLRWQFLRWINNFWGGGWTRTDGKQDPDGLRTIWSYQTDEFKNHKHSWGWLVTTWWSNQYWNMTGWSHRPYGSNMENTWWLETRSKNVWVIYCVKN